jgi:cell division septum initiation protein DivIVA
MSEDCPVDIRVEDDETPTLEEIFIAGQPVGVLLDNARQEIKQSTKRIRQLEAANEELKDRLAELESRIDGVEDRADAVENTVYAEGKQGKVRQLVEYATNKRTGEQQAVVLDAQEIRGATGCTRRYAYDIIDDFPGDYGFLVDRDELTQYGEVELDQTQRGRGIAVIFDGSVHSDLESVNRFTTRTEGDA